MKTQKQRNLCKSNQQDSREVCVFHSILNLSCLKIKRTNHMTLHYWLQQQLAYSINTQGIHKSSLYRRSIKIQRSLSFSEDYIFNRLNTSGVITLHFGSGPKSVFCHKEDFGCGNGGWTPVMKIDGNKVKNSHIDVQKSRHLFIVVWYKGQFACAIIKIVFVWISL